ncbi:hypothetical protein BLNAU_13462 [Blattamonas nauphoetae]|uniref:Origin recognition complex subunit 1 n=1 Tax=Blattamonas nauphoetae TaxID=2049346 RepID=A0ABQ9XGJ5_9EUKA|nr:hypothetical protein BLNAU_13462 [Blattamonas nauphoetae]
MENAQPIQQDYLDAASIKIRELRHLRARFRTSYVPGTFHARSEQISAIQNHIKTHIVDENDRTLLVASGVPGTGKTACILSSIRQLGDEIVNDSSGSLPTLHFLEFNAAKSDNPALLYSFVYEFLKQIVIMSSEDQPDDAEGERLPFGVIHSTGLTHQIKSLTLAEASHLGSPISPAFRSPFNDLISPISIRSQMSPTSSLPPIPRISPTTALNHLTAMFSQEISPTSSLPYHVAIIFIDEIDYLNRNVPSVLVNILKWFQRDVQVSIQNRQARVRLILLSAANETGFWSSFEQYCAKHYTANLLSGFTLPKTSSVIFGQYSTQNLESIFQQRVQGENAQMAAGRKPELFNAVVMELFLKKIKQGGMNFRRLLRVAWEVTRLSERRLKAKLTRNMIRSREEIEQWGIAAVDVEVATRNYSDRQTAANVMSECPFGERLVMVLILEYLNRHGVTQTHSFVDGTTLLSFFKGLQKGQIPAVLEINRLNGEMLERTLKSLWEKGFVILKRKEQGGKRAGMPATGTDPTPKSTHEKQREAADRRRTERWAERAEKRRAEDLASFALSGGIVESTQILLVPNARELFDLEDQRVAMLAAKMPPSEESVETKKTRRIQPQTSPLADASEFQVVLDQAKTHSPSGRFTFSDFALNKIAELSGTVVYQQDLALLELLRKHQY